jgi:hypothetical protein
MSFNYVRDLFLQYSVEKGDLVPMLEDCFEDMGGHTWHESNFTEDIVRDIVEGWSEDERSEVLTLAGPHYGPVTKFRMYSQACAIVSKPHIRALRTALIGHLSYKCLSA